MSKAQFPLQGLPMWLAKHDKCLEGKEPGIPLQGLAMVRARIAEELEQMGKPEM